MPALLVVTVTASTGSDALRLNKMRWEVGSAPEKDGHLRTMGVCMVQNLPFFRALGLGKRHQWTKVTLVRGSKCIDVR